MKSHTSSLNQQLITKATPLACGLVFVVIVAIFFVYLIQPEIRQYEPGGPLDVEAKRKIVEDRKQYLDDLRKLNTLYTTYGVGEQSAVSTIVPDAKDIPGVFSGYELLAKRMKIGLESIDIINQDGKAKGIPGAKEIIVSLRLSNVDYAKFKDFLGVLETSSRFIDVVSFDIQPESRFSTVTLKTYYFSK